MKYIIIILAFLLTGCIHQKEDCTSCAGIVKYMGVGQ